MDKTSNRGFSSLSDLVSDIESSPSTVLQPISPKTSVSQKQVFDLLDMTELPTCPIPWSSTNDGETWVWGDFFFLFEKNPKPVFEKELEKSGQNIEWYGLIFHYSMSVFYRIDKNPHGPLQKPIMSVTLEQADSNMPLEVQRGLESETHQPREPKKEEPMKITLFSGGTETDLGEYDGDFNPVAVKRRFFEILKEELGVQGQPKMIGDLIQGFGHPETGLPPRKIEYYFGSKRVTNQETNQEKNQEKNQKKNQEKNSSSSLKWLLGIVSLIMLVLVIIDTNQTSKRHSYNQSRSGKNVVNERPLEGAVLEVGLQVKKPSVGKEKVLSVMELRWCVQELIRIQEMKEFINTKEGRKKYQAMVADYNNRCGGNIYRGSDLSQAKLDVEPYRNQIISEAISQAKDWSKGNIPSDSSTFYKSDIKQSNSDGLLNDNHKIPSNRVIREAQQLLTNLGYKLGPVDGIFGTRTAAAVKAFQRNQGITQNGLIDQGLLKLLRRKNDNLSPKK